MKNRAAGNAALFLTALIWGLSFVAQRAGMEYIEPFTFNAVRSFLGVLSLIPLIFWESFIRNSSGSFIKAGFCCGFALFVALSLQQYCMQYVDAGKAGFISALYILFVPVISVIFGQKLEKKFYTSIFISLAGLYFLCFRPGCEFCIYDLILLVSAFFYAIHIMVVSYFSTTANAVKISCLQFFVVGIFSSILMLFFETPASGNISACKVPLLTTGILTFGIAYTLQIFGQKYTLPVVASLILCLESVFAILGGFLILGETLDGREAFGCLLMITAVVIANIKRGMKV